MVVRIRIDQLPLGSVLSSIFRDAIDKYVKNSPGYTKKLPEINGEFNIAKRSETDPESGFFLSMIQYHKVFNGFTYSYQIYKSDFGEHYLFSHAVLNRQGRHSPAVLNFNDYVEIIKLVKEAYYE